MKKNIIAACVAAVMALSGAGMYYFAQHYTVLSEEDVAELRLYLVTEQYKAFQLGKQVCKDST